MSSSINFLGKFNNGKIRCKGSFVSTNGLNNSKLYLNQEDASFIEKVADMDKKSFNYCIENNKFKELVLVAHYEGAKVIEENIDLSSLRKITKEIAMQYIEKVNKEVRKQVQKEFNRPFKYLTEDAKEKVYLHWYIMQPINKNEEEKRRKFSSLTNETSRIDDNYNIIFNV